MDDGTWEREKNGETRIGLGHLCFHLWVADMERYTDRDSGPLLSGKKSVFCPSSRALEKGREHRLYYSGYPNTLVFLRVITLLIDCIIEARPGLVSVIKSSIKDIYRELSTKYRIVI